MSLLTHIAGSLQSNHIQTENVLTGILRITEMQIGEES
jgi:hypothetical protein